ncbi:zinc metallopeptidase [Aliamphritea hakodatensis]|uniref:zinc metallopeptidase n=1 Tax=Aliamphritea hakodatensis TaxID=2895352 RepID=UPI0022FD8A6F|nr:zinc metallopeptidase [Aliamphritea hakodatensis]
MLFILLGLILVVLAFGPQYWVRHIIRKHHTPLENMPGTGAELAAHLIERFKLEGVRVQETGPDQNYYSPAEKIVGLAPDVFHGRSLSSVAIATHEVGHAIQYNRQEAVSKLRSKYTVPAKMVQGIGIFILSSTPFIGLLAKAPAVMALTVVAGIATMLASVVFHAMVLPEEYDASFGKALPILEEGYVPEEHLPAVREVLKAAAYTYVAGALADILSIWRWLLILR